MMLKKRNILIELGMVLFLIFFLILNVWWFFIFYRGLTEGFENNAFTLIYPLMALFGGLVGLSISKTWGGVKSHFGSALLFFSLGLLAQFFGQASYAYLIYIQSIPVPYPSIGDVGYFGSIFFYIFALIRLGRVVGVKKHFISLKGQFVAFAIPAILLVSSYFLFLRGYSFDWSNSIKVFFDFGYPLGQAIYVSIALVILFFSLNTLGGVMRRPVLFLVFTLIIQYFCDFMFLYQANQGNWYVGGINDYLYFISYFCMTMAIANLGLVFDKIRSN